jgi:carboxylate-amine ligase
MDDSLVDASTVALVPAWELADALVDHVGPALKEAGDDHLVAEGLARIRERGTGARQQREAFAEGDMRSLIDTLTALTVGR